METIANISSGRFGRFACSSLASTALDQLVACVLFALLREFFVGADFVRILLATCIARCISTAVNFCINNRMVFCGTEEEPCRCKRESLPRFLLLELGVLCLSSLGVWLAHEGFGIAEGQAKVVVDFTLFFLNYTGQRKWVFADPSAQEQVVVA